MSDMSQFLDKRRLDDLAADPDYIAKSEKIDAKMGELSYLLAERAVLNTAGQALDASRRAAFEAMCTDAAPIRTTPAEDPTTDDWCTSLLPLGDAQVMVCYSSDGTDLSVEGAMINAEFVHIDCFTSVVRGQWYRAIRAEEAKDAEIAGWTK